MAQFVSDKLKDKGLEYLGTRAAAGYIKQVVCAGAPANFAEANTTADGGANKKKTGEVAMVAGDFTVGAAVPSGRQATIGAKSVTLSYAGATQNSNHVVLLDTNLSEILAYTHTTAGRDAPSGDTLNLQAWSVIIEDPEVL